ncbi:MAG: alpha/beta hydrolase fold domain-containing protein, partial [Mycobacterium sp.]|uniref:alpha/beta hydrolase n=1 Tax=Mycobacterium sp. TaxID=1785 RepID=UPI003C5BEE9E
MPTTDFHPDLRRVARLAPRTLVGPRSLHLIRKLSPVIQRGAKARDGVEVLTLGSGVGVRLHRPVGVSQRSAALLWIHGGGYVLGTAQQDDALCHRFSRELGVTVASVDYRLAPEHPYPAPLEDCYSALTWLASLPAVDPARVAIG